MRVLGLTSGTSMDGITTALTDIENRGTDLEVELPEWFTTPYPRELKRQLLNSAEDGSVRQACRLNFQVGRQFGKAAQRTLDNSSRGADLIGSHDEIACHLPEKTEGRATYSLQMGEDDVIAEVTGLTTITHFRTRDVAVGGEGSRLIPYVDYELLSSSLADRATLNLGGMPRTHTCPAESTGKGPQYRVGQFGYSSYCDSIHR